jgi:hypothetical protein
MLFLQVDDAAVKIRLLLLIFVSKVHLFYTQITEHTGGGGERGVSPLTFCVG